MSEQKRDQAAAQARELLTAARSRLPWLKRVGVLPGACPGGQDVWREVFAAGGVTVLWPELCEEERELVGKAYRLLELGAEILIASPTDADVLADSGLLAPVFTIGEGCC